MVFWGICMVTLGLTHNFQGMMAARFFLGVAEAGLFPGVIFPLFDNLFNKLYIYSGNCILNSYRGQLLPLFVVQAK